MVRGVEELPLLLPPTEAADGPVLPKVVSLPPLFELLARDQPSSRVTAILTGLPPEGVILTQHLRREELGEGEGDTVRIGMKGIGKNVWYLKHHSVILEVMLVMSLRECAQ